MDPGLEQRGDAELACLARAGSSQAYEDLVRRYEGRLYGFLVRYTRHAQDAEDLCQKTFVAAWKALARYDETRRFGAWLFMIAHRAAIDHYRARRDWDELDENLAAAPAAGAGETADLWSAARRCLSEPQFTALWLMYAEGLSVKEIAAGMRRTAVGVKVLLHRARRALARELAPDYGRGWAGGAKGVMP